MRCAPDVLLRGGLSPYVLVLTRNPLLLGQGDSIYCISPTTTEGGKQVSQTLAFYTPEHPTHIGHEELGVTYIRDKVAVRPLLGWVKIWANPEATFSRQIIVDCLAHDRGLNIPWLKYVKEVLGRIGCQELFHKPTEITSQDKVRAKNELLKYVTALREDAEGGKQTVRDYTLMRTCGGIEPYLCLLYNAQDRFLLTRFRFNLLHHILADPAGFTVSTELKGVCGCDNRSPQDTLHFVLLGPFYSLPRCCFLKSILKKAKLRQPRVALVFLQMAKDNLTLFCIVNFLRLAVKLRRTRGT